VPGRKQKDGSRRLIERNWMTVWNYKKLIFDGSARKFLAFCQKRESDSRGSRKTA
jgi:hypothetical protein